MLGVRGQVAGFTPYGLACMQNHPVHEDLSLPIYRSYLGVLLVQIDPYIDHALLSAIGNDFVYILPLSRLPRFVPFLAAGPRSSSLAAAIF